MAGPRGSCPGVSGLSPRPHVASTTVSRCAHGLSSPAPRRSSWSPSVWLGRQRRRTARRGPGPGLAFRSWPLARPSPHGAQRRLAGAPRGPAWAADTVAEDKRAAGREAGRAPLAAPHASGDDTHTDEAERGPSSVTATGCERPPGAAPHPRSSGSAAAPAPASPEDTHRRRGVAAELGSLCFRCLCPGRGAGARPCPLTGGPHSRGRPSLSGSQRLRRSRGHGEGRPAPGTESDRQSGSAGRGAGGGVGALVWRRLPPHTVLGALRKPSSSDFRRVQAHRCFPSCAQTEQGHLPATGDGFPDLSVWRSCVCTCVGACVTVSSSVSAAMRFLGLQVRDIRSETRPETTRGFACIYSTLQLHMRFDFASCVTRGDGARVRQTRCEGGRALRRRRQWGHGLR